MLTEAIREYSEVIRLNPGDADAYSSLAGLYAFYWNDHRTATMLYRKCVAIDPADYTSHYSLAESYDALGRTREARAHRFLAEQLSRSQKQ